MGKRKEISDSQISTKKKKTDIIHKKYNIKEQIIDIGENAYRSDYISFSLSPFKRICNCTDKKELSDRCFDTLESILDYADTEFVQMVYKYNPSFFFCTPSVNDWREKNRYHLTVGLRNFPDPKLRTFFPIIFGTRLHAYCKIYPDTDIIIEKMYTMSPDLYCMNCHPVEYILNKAPNTFKISGRIMHTCNFLILKEKRRPFLDDNGILVWFVNKQKIRSCDEVGEEDLPGFQNLSNLKNHFKSSGYIGHCSILPTGGVFVKALHSFLCVVYNTTTTFLKTKTNLTRYEKNLIMGNVDSIIGTIKFQNVNENMGVTDQPLGTAYKMAINTKSKSEGYHKPKTSYLPVGMDYKKYIFSGMKMIPHMSKDPEIRKIHEDELGLIAIPDTTDGKNCGLNFQFVPGTKISNRLTTRMDIGRVFRSIHDDVIHNLRILDEDDAGLYLLTDSLNKLNRIECATHKSITNSVLKLIEMGVHFDIYIEDKCGIIFSFNGTLVYPTLNMTAETLKWLRKNMVVDISHIPILSIIVSTTPFFNHDCNSRLVGASKSRIQDIDSLPYSEIARDYSHPHSINMVHSHKSLSDSDDFGTVQNAVVAISCMGFNVEEAIILNRSAVERGLFMTRELKRLPFVFKKLHDIPLRINNLKKRKKLKNGSLLFEILGVSTCNSYSTEIEVIQNAYGFEFNYRDCLYVERYGYTGHKEWTILDHSIHHDGDNVTIVIEVESVNFCLEGDKLTTSHGQKGIVSKMIDSIDMPFFADGTVPDIVINIASNDRMTIGQNFEGYNCFDIANSGDISHTVGPESEWRTENIEPVYQSLYSGTTGLYIGESEMMIIPYRRLKQDAEQTLQNTIYKYGLQKMDVITGQLQKGKSNRGGVSLGTMENANVFAIGSKLFGKHLSQTSSGSFDNALNYHVGMVNRTAASINDVLSVNGYIMRLTSKYD